MLLITTVTAPQPPLLLLLPANAVSTTTTATAAAAAPLMQLLPVRPSHNHHHNVHAVQSWLTASTILLVSACPQVARIALATLLAQSSEAVSTSAQCGSDPWASPAPDVYVNSPAKQTVRFDVGGTERFAHVHASARGR